MDKREQYIRKLDAKLREWNAELEKIAARIDQAGAERRIELQKKYEQVKAQRDDVRSRMDKLKNSTGEAWQEIKSGLEAAWKKLDESFQEARKTFK